MMNAARQAELWQGLRAAAAEAATPAGSPPAGGVAACQHCGGDLTPEVSGLPTCAECGALGDEPGPGPASADATSMAHLRVKGGPRGGGAAAARLTRDMFRSGERTTTESQIQTTFRNLLNKQKNHLKENPGWHPLPDEVFMLTARYYNIHVQQMKIVMRGGHKNSVMGKLLLLACQELARPPGTCHIPRAEDICTFFDLPVRGSLAEGEAYMAGLAKHCTVFGQDTTDAIVNSMFAHMGFVDRPGGPSFAPPRACAVGLVEHMRTQRLALDSMLLSRQAAASWLVLSQWPDRDLLAGLGTFADFCAKAKIRDNTIKNVLQKLAAYRSIVAPMLAQHGVLYAP